MNIEDCRTFYADEIRYAGGIRSEALIKAALTNGSLLKIKSVRQEAHEKDQSCIVHGSKVCISSVEIPSS